MSVVSGLILVRTPPLIRNWSQTGFSKVGDASPPILILQLFLPKILILHPPLIPPDSDSVILQEFEPLKKWGP